MTKKMLIDATHAEETRVAVIAGNKLEEYDYENITRKQLKGNIYLVKVTRVEPSLQAAFVDFGGNRHGFLPFPEIHPDYYRIPIEDREALIAEEKAMAAAQAAREEAEDAAAIAAEERGETAPFASSAPDNDGDDNEDESTIEIVGGGENIEPAEGDVTPEQATETTLAADAPDLHITDSTPASDDSAENEDSADTENGEDFDNAGGDSDEKPSFRSSLKRRYKIQEVIKRNQIMLIQIGKEERGNKGAAVTSYISLPGRYCVLMPNSPRGGGVSRKVSNAKDRQRLKKILQELGVPDGMSVILRTAGVARSLEEIKRDLDYLLRLWDQIRELTLKSTAPALIYEEGNLIKRAIRDLYRRDISEVHVAGEDGFKTARDFMRTLMPSHAEKVFQYNDPSIPLFSRHQVERQIDEIHNPTVRLRSGGYIVINPTEAMVSIDVNSGKATKGRHIEETALKTNLEAAEEIARQLRLRDQGGLIVIDFIDMEDRRGNRTVEKRLRDAMSSDRARIQLGRISPFGLLELSRQRLHPSLVESNFETCAHCLGTGLVRTVETASVMILRAIEEEAVKSKSDEIKVAVPTEVAIYILNHKRVMIADIEKRHQQRIFIHADAAMIKPNYTIESSRGADPTLNRQGVPRLAPVQTVDMSDLPEIQDAGPDLTVAEEMAEEDFSGNIRETASDSSESPQGHGHGHGHRHGRGGDRGDRNNRRNRGGRGSGRHDRGDRHQNRPAQNVPIVDGQPVAFDAAVAEGGAESQPQQNGKPGHSRGNHGDRNDNGKRRGRRGGRGRNGRRDDRPRQDGNFNPQRNVSPSDAPTVAFEAPQTRDTSQPRNDAPRSSSPMQDTGPVVSSAADGNGGDKSRKGWWKRLTE